MSRFTSGSLQLLAAIAIALSSGGAEAQLIYDDFEDGDDAGWTRSNRPDVTEAFSVVGGKYVIDGTSPTEVLVEATRLEPAANFGDFAFSVDLAWSLDRNVGILARASGVGPGTLDGYLLEIDALFGDLRILQIDDDVFTNLAVSANSAGLPEAVRLVFSGQGGVLRGEIYRGTAMDFPAAVVKVAAPTFSSGFPGLFVRTGFDPTPASVPAAFDRVLFANLDSGDADGDGLLDGFEIVNMRSDPSLADTDGDGVDDGTEYADGRMLADYEISDGQASSPESVGSVDLDGDGDEDVLVARWNSPRALFPAQTATFAWHENDGTAGGGTYHPVSKTGNGAPDASEGGRAIAAADLDGDVAPDVIGASQVDGKVTWYSNFEGGVAGQFGDRQVVGTQAVPLSIAVADFNYDGMIDIATGGFNNVVVWTNELDGAGGFTSTSYTGFSLVYDLAVADIDGDALVDLVVLDTNGDRIVWFENTLTTGGAPVSLVQHPTAIATEASPSDSRRMNVVDIDRDGDPDVVKTSLTDGEIEWYENPTIGGGSTWTRHLVVSSLPQTLGITAEDFDLDGHVDLAVASSVSAAGGVRLYRSDGGSPPSFSAGTPLETDADGALELKAVRLSGKGWDLLMGTNDGGRVTWFANSFQRYLDPLVPVSSIPALPISASLALGGALIAIGAARLRR